MRAAVLPFKVIAGGKKAKPVETKGNTYHPYTLDESASNSAPSWNLTYVAQRLRDLDAISPAHVAAVGLLVERLLSDAERKHASKGRER